VTGMVSNPMITIVFNLNVKLTFVDQIQLCREAKAASSSLHPDGAPLASRRFIMITHQ
jgi:hypothetical protein